MADTAIIDLPPPKKSGDAVRVPVILPLLQAGHPRSLSPATSECFGESRALASLALNRGCVGCAIYIASQLGKTSPLFSRQLFSRQLFSGQRPEVRLPQIGGSGLSGSAVIIRNRVRILRINSGWLRTESFPCRRSMCACTVCGDTCSRRAISDSL